VKPQAAIKALLLDLDGTLLRNDMEQFVPAYLEAAGRFLGNRIAPERLIRELLRATRIMAANRGDGATNEEVFAATFYPAVGVDRAELEPLFMRFYSEEFPGLRRFTQAVPEAPKLVRWAFECGLKVVVATNPLFPRTAIEQRLEWAGVGVDAHPYALVTTYENMHASKENPAYYREVLDRIGCSPEACLMVGDDWVWDMENASKLGIGGWWVAPEDEPRPAESGSLFGQGTLADLWRLILAGDRDPRILARSAD